MNDYFKLSFTMTPKEEFEADILSALLCDAGFESFVGTDDGVEAYIKKELYDENAIPSILEQYPFNAHIEIKSELIPGQDWNSEWEKNYFKPILFEDKCVIHSSFHKDYPAAKYDITIDPKMAFGTGHHETTSLMIKRILDSDMTGTSVLDMGTGTGILAILSSMVGATRVVGVEIDPPAYDNAVINAQLNNQPNIDMRLGGSETLDDGETFDYVLANINRNIILMDIANYAKALKPGGRMFLSGFYLEDVSMLVDAAKEYGLEQESVIDKKNWANICLIKE